MNRAKTPPQEVPLRLIYVGRLVRLVIGSYRLSGCRTCFPFSPGVVRPSFLLLDMSDNIHISFAISLLIAVAWTTDFSMTNNPGIRGFRNLGILASYVLFMVFLFIADWKAWLVTWVVFGLAGGALYILWEVIQRLRTAAGEEKPGVSPMTFFYGLFAWPIMVPEAVEYTLAEIGVLRAPSVTDAEASGAGRMVTLTRRLAIRKSRTQHQKSQVHRHSMSRRKVTGAAISVFRAPTYLEAAPVASLVLCDHERDHPHLECCRGRRPTRRGSAVAARLRGIALSGGAAPGARAGRANLCVRTP